MRMLVRVGIALILLLVLGFVGLLLALPRIAASDAVRERLEAAGHEATGGEVSYEKLSVGLLPPRLVVHAPRVLEPGGQGKPVLEAESVDLVLAVLPLLARVVVIDALVVDGVGARLVRTEDGIELPFGRPPEGEPEEPQGKEEQQPAQDDESGFSFAVAGLELRRSRLSLEDRTVSPPLVWELVDLEATARGQSLQSPLDLVLGARIASGGHVNLSGSASLDGSVDLAAKLEGVVLDPAAAYFSRGRTLAGTVSGALQVQGPLTAPNSLDVDLVFQDALVHLEDMTFRGRLALRTQLEGGVEEPSGPFEIDATEAQVEYGGGFVISKPRGTPATATGRLVREPDGDFDLRDLRLEIRNLEAEGKLRTGSRERLELSAPPFEIVGWGELVPALAPYAPTGRIAVPRLALVPDPLDLRGRIDLQDLRLRPPGRAPVTLRGAFEGHGASLGSSELEAIVAEQRVGLDLELRGLATTPRYRVRANTRGADTNALLGALAGLDDTLHGPLTADADLSGPLGGSAEPLAALVGRARLEIGRGRLKGVSILGDTLEGLGTLGEAALLAEQRRGSKSLQRFTGDEFESISGSFDLAGGRARTDDLRLVYRNYSVDLRGSLGFLDESLDLTGKLTIDEEVDAALAPGPGGTASRPKVIPLARVRGTLRSPRIELTREAVVALGLGYQGSQRREKWEEEIDERLGEGSGREVLDALEGILGGRRESPPR